MKLIKHIVSILLLSFGLSIELSGLAQIKESTVGTASVIGRVLLKGEPVSDVTVVLEPQRKISPTLLDSIVKTRTGANGQYRITGLVAGEYQISAVAPGYISEADDRAGRMGAVVNLGDGEQVDNINIELKRGGVITGRVMDANNRPVVEERVELLKLDGNGRPRQLLVYGHVTFMQISNTDDRGIYRIYGLPDGRYLASIGYSPGAVNPRSLRTSYLKTFYPDTKEQARARVIEIKEGSEVTGVDINVGELKRAYDIKGRVLDAESGQPVAGVSVDYREAREISGFSGSSGGMRSNVHGEFHIQNVFPGKYNVSPTFGDEGGYYGSSTVVEVKDHDLYGIEIRVQSAGSISGKVIIEGVDDAKILSKFSQFLINVSRRTDYPPKKDPAPILNRSVNVNLDGSFQIKGLPPGKMDLQLGIPLTLSNVVEHRIEHNGAAIPKRQGIDLDAGQHITNVLIVGALANSSVRGEVRIIGGSLPLDARLYIYASGGIEVGIAGRSEIDGHGRFAINKIPAGEYDLEISLSQVVPGLAQKYPELLRKLAQLKQKVLVAPGLPQEVVIHLDLSRKE